MSVKNEYGTINTDINKEIYTMSLANLNAYDKDAWITAFTGTPEHTQLASEYDTLLWESSNDEPTGGYSQPDGPTPRQFMGTSTPSKASATIFYYLENITAGISLAGEKIYDLGCGWNWFKNYYPDIWGVGEEDPDSAYYFGDEHDVVDEAYIFEHLNTFKCFIAVNSLHFKSITEISDIVENGLSMLEPGGRALITCNSTVLLSMTTEAELNSLFSTTEPTTAQQETYIREQLDTITDITWRIVDIDLTNDNDGLDGNIRLAFSKPE